MTPAMPFLLDPASWEDWKDWLGSHGLRIVSIILVLLVIEFIFRRVVSRWILSAISSAGRVRREDQLMVRRRAQTLTATLNWAFGLFLAFLGAGLVLAEVGLNVSALIAGVGVVGIALGLGAQTLVKDVINGMFILIEDQYAVGDQVTVAGATGEVVEINPRRTVVRDADGNVHSIPNSAITVAVNRTAALNRFRIDIEVPFRDADRIATAINDVAADVARDLHSEIISRPVIASRSVVGDGGEVRIQLVGDAHAAARWTVETELRRRLKRRFDAERLDGKFENEPVEAAKS